VTAAIDRRTTLRWLLAAFAYAIARPRLAAAGDADDPGNFRAIYSDPKLRERFYLFLENVFHLYPEERFHELIADASAKHAADREVYEDVQKRLPTIKPRFSNVTYALPALAKQKDEMARQTAELLAPVRSIRGYVEIGTPGRYVKALRKRIPIMGTVVVMNDAMPGLSLEDVFERGQLRKAGRYAPLGNYDGFDAGRIGDASVDLVSIYIGFHHAPADRLDPFVASIRRVLRPGGKLVVRDHDVDGRDTSALVGLAHDVFNAGVGLSWRENHDQIRNFKSIAELDSYLGARGFRRTGGAELQHGDPTRNTLLLFSKTA
jgi:SAM-dependent methyltransferase